MRRACLTTKARGRSSAAASRSAYGSRSSGGAQQRLPVALVEPVVDVAGEDVHVEVPHVLAAGRLVVLTGGDARAVVRRAHRHRDLLRQVPDGVADVGGDAVEVLVVGTRDHERGTGVARPPPRGDARDRRGR